MNYTKSGIPAIGAPMSRARFLEEVKQGLDNCITLLLTDEGNALANRFFRTLGCAPDEMPKTVKADILTKHQDELWKFLTGVKFALELT